MQNSLHPYAVDGTIIHGNTRENVVLLIYTHNAEIAENHIRIYAQQHQLRLSYQFRPQPFELYLQHHANPDFISPLTTLSTTLSENNPFIIFNPNQYQENEKSIDPSLTKETFLLREEDEYSPFLFQPIPRSMKLHLWQGNSESQCYAIVNAAVSFWFPRHFEVDGIRYECLFKGEEAEKRKKVAPYLLHLPENHPVVEQLCSVPPKPQEDGEQHWHKNFGFFFRSSADFETLLHHFRKFIYMNTYDDRLLYFRFYDPIVLEEYFDFLQHYPRKLSTFWGKGLIDSFILPKQQNAVCYTPNIDFSQVEPAKKQFDQFEMKKMIAKKDQKLLARLVEELVGNYPYFLDKYSQKEIENVVQYYYQMGKKYGFYETTTLGFLSLATLFYGETVDRLDPERIITKLLTLSYLSEQEKIYYIQQRLDVLEQQKQINNYFKEVD
ncbi:hypothetical protein BKG95_02810 [Rodentibacter pneumotropicus]|uniref:DUF4123 domain-containing protein n=1 Tax=Rodentibacter pneumotropicus TaxID=758 RepID=A0AAW5LAH4_9PAST|nr:DUF4123 domain-containing protein [Rodentibacter pneumotropicus]MCQ9121050.1 DUF4123 domain-containing protein [Rodentibacter pneumotropicus]OOF69210.1 hypothetical protein BKG95_02810 [Rodentibacter pneumotropicus]